MEPSNFLTLQPSNQSIYFFVINGKPEGPFTLQQLKGLKIKPADFVKTGEMDDYKEAHEIAELRDFLGFKKPPVIPQYFGSFDQRVLASALDWFFVSGACIVIAFLIVLILFLTTLKSDGSYFMRAAISLSQFIVIPTVNFFYHVIMESSSRQGTYGKQLLKIKVCDMQGERITFAHALGRNLAKIVSALPLFIGYLFIFFNKQQQAMHDMIAGTLVMKDRLF